MRILDNLFGQTVDNYAKSMTRTTLRQQLLTNNLANVNTPGFKRSDVNFGIVLQGAQRKFGDKNEEPGIYTDPSSIRADGNNVDLETEVEGLSETEVRYNALTEMTSEYFSDLKSVIKGGS